MGSILETIKQRELSGAGDRFNLLFANAAYGAAAIVPARFRWIVPALVENIALPVPEFRDVKAEVIRTLTGVEDDVEVLEGEILPPHPPLYTAYRCVHHNPLQCEWPAQTLIDDPNAKTCLRCGFPALLPTETQIQGKRGRYQIESFLRSRNFGRLYRAIDLLDRQPIIIKEYIFPERHFESAEIQRRQQSFDLFTNLELADRRQQDLRWDVPPDAIAPFGEARAYSILKELPHGSPPLSAYLRETGPLSAFHVRQILLQVLQSLEGLHEQKYRLPTGIVQTGIIHGNISLDSLIIVPNFQGFYIYLCDPAAWEHLCVPPNLEMPEVSVAADLKALGEVAFYLLVGRVADPETHQPIDPGVPEYWPEETPEFLRQFILSLVGLSNLPFPSARLARQALLKFPIPEPVTSAERPPAELETEKSKKKIPSWLWIVLAILILAGFLSVVIFIFGRRLTSRQAPSAPPICCVDQIAGLPPQEIPFTGEGAGVWTMIWTQENLIAKGKSLAGEIDRRLNPPSEEEEAAAAATTEGANTASPDAETAANPDNGEASPAETEAETEVSDRVFLNYLPQPSATIALDKIRTQEADFAVTSLIDNLGIDLWYQRFAYDAIVVYVAFSYAERENNIAQGLQGSLTFDQLRRLYTGEITNWQELGGPDLAVKLYIPDNEEAVKIFEERILQAEDAIAQFRELTQRRSRVSAASTEITSLSTFRTLNAVLRDFEGQQIGAIAFGSLSQVFGQCSVYPLAIRENPLDLTAVSPLLDAQGLPITPSVDLCNQKGSYRVNIEAMRDDQYPLVYPLAVVYPRDNRRQPIGEAFAALLQTDEAQLLLQEAGLIPLRELDEAAIRATLEQSP